LKVIDGGTLEKSVPGFWGLSLLPQHQRHHSFLDTKQSSLKF